MIDEARPNIIPLTEKQPTLARRLGKGQETRRLRRMRMVWPWAYALLVILPTFTAATLSATYFSSRYTSGAGFSLRGLDMPIPDTLGALTGFTSGTSLTTESYMLLKFLHSRDIVERLEADFPLRNHFTSSSLDWFHRLPATAAQDDLVDYWRNRLTTSYNTASGILSFEIEAFDPASAARIAALLLTYSQDFVNQLSGNTRRDTLSFAEAEVARSERRVKSALQALRSFRDRERTLDPDGMVRNHLELLAGLERQRADLRARIASLDGMVDADAPQRRALLRQLRAIEDQIALPMASSTLGASTPQEPDLQPDTLSAQIATYETLEVERNLAQQFYASALQSLEKARIETGRQHRYLAIYARPSIPDRVAAPSAIFDGALIFVLLSFAFAIAALLIAAIREHRL